MSEQISVKTLREWANGDRPLDILRGPNPEVLALLDAVEAAQERDKEVDGPSGLREQLVAARKGEQIELRLRQKAEAENERLEKAILVLAGIIKIAGEDELVDWFAGDRTRQPAVDEYGASYKIRAEMAEAENERLERECAGRRLEQEHLSSLVTELEAEKKRAEER